MHLKKKCQENYVDICKSNFGMTKGQSDEVKYLIDKIGFDFYDRKGKADYESVILCMCWIILQKNLNIVNRRWLKKKILHMNPEIEQLYKPIKEKMQ